MLMPDIKNGWRRTKFSMSIPIARTKHSKHRTVTNVSVSCSDSTRVYYPSSKAVLN